MEAAEEQELGVSCTLAMFGRVVHVKALTPEEHYFCPETADML